MTEQEPTYRPSARVLLLNEQDQLLLFKARLSGKDFEGLPHVWFTVGGALEARESFEQAARRELSEETGLIDTDLGRHVWTRRHRWIDDDAAVYDSDDRFFLARALMFGISDENWSEIERGFMLAYRWWALDEIEKATDETFVPRRLADFLRPLLAGDIPAAPIDVGA